MTGKTVECLHFGGLWKTDHDQLAELESRGEATEPTFLFFLGDDFLLVTRITYQGEKVANLDHTSFIYDVDPTHLTVWRVKAKLRKPKLLRWRLIDRRYLELNEKGRWLRYSPTSIEDMERLGVPRAYFETWIDVFENQLDSFVVLRPVVPDFGKRTKQ